MVIKQARVVPPVRRETMLFVKIFVALLIFSAPLTVPVIHDFVKGLPTPQPIQYGDEGEPYIFESYIQAFKHMLFFCSAPAFFVAFTRMILAPLIEKDEKRKNAMLIVGTVAMVVYWPLTWLGII